MADSDSGNNRDSKWYFTKEQLENSPSRSHGIDANKELELRQQTAYLIQDMGQRLRVNQLCINTAIVYMHRFYTFHSFTQFHQNGIAMAALFLAAKVEEQPRKLETVISVSQTSLYSIAHQDIPKDVFHDQAQELVFNENVLLQTLGFDVAVDHPHTHVVRTCQLVKAVKDLAQTSYFLASNSLHLTTMCLQYKPTVVACFCIHLACQWSGWEIPLSTKGMKWFYYVDKDVTTELLQRLTVEFLEIYERSPTRLKSKLHNGQGPFMDGFPRSKNEDGSSSSRSSGVPRSSSSHHRSSSSSTSQSANSGMSQTRVPRTTSTTAHRMPQATTTNARMPPNVPHTSTSSSSSASTSNSQLRPAHPTASNHSKAPHPSSSAPSSTNANRPRGEPESASSWHGSSSNWHRADTTKTMQQRATERAERKTSSSSDKYPPPQQQQQQHRHSAQQSSSQSQQQQQQQHQQQQQQRPHQQSSVQPTKPQPSLMDTSSYRLNDDIGTIPSLDSMENLLSTTPPKQSVKAPSIFSPEWNEKPSSLPSLANTASNGSNTGGANGSEVNTSKTIGDESNERKRAMPSNDVKKDKMNDASSISTQQHQQQPQHQQQHRLNNNMKREAPMPSTMQYDTNLPHNILDSKSAVSLKRPYSASESMPSNDGSDYRDIKVRKKEQLSPLANEPASMSKNYGSNSYDESKSKSFMSTASMNGIETNPDMVSSLLKEGLSDNRVIGTLASNDTSTNTSTTNTRPLSSSERFNASSFTEQSQMHSMPSQPTSIQHQPQQQQSQPMMTEQQLPAQLIETDAQRSKSEKKKKKEKHKNKDKTKNREERKKHKKDKDRSKDKERSHHGGDGHSASADPIRITIAKEKLNYPQNDMGGNYDANDISGHTMAGMINVQMSNASQSGAGVKLKIAKERIRSDEGEHDGTGGSGVGGSGNGNVSFSSTSMPSSASTSLKIKISKDVLGSGGNVGGAMSGAVGAMPTGSNMYPMQSNDTSQTKKKERNREREKSIKNSNNPNKMLPSRFNNNELAHQFHQRHNNTNQQVDMSQTLALAAQQQQHQQQLQQQHYLHQRQQQQQQQMLMAQKLENAHKQSHNKSYGY